MFKIKRTKTLKIPFPYILDSPIQFWDIKYITYFRRIYKAIKTIDRIEGDNVFLKDKWVFKIDSFEMMVKELPEWSYYLPSFSLKGKTVLDIGAGCGETAKYFLDNGAKNVVCVEPNINYVELLLDNMMIFPILPVMAKFDIEQISKYPHDLLKMDIEGYETLLINAFNNNELNPSKMKTIILEAHSEYIINEFEKYNFKVLKKWRNNLAIMSNEDTKDSIPS